MAENGTPAERVTMRTLNYKLELLDARQKNEHLKTRAFVVLLTAPGWAKALPLIMGYLGWGY